MYNEQIKTFITVADTGSFSKASEKLFITTVSVMKQINALENHISAKLLKRSNQGVTLTKEGEFIYKTAKQIIEISDNAINKIKKNKKEELYTIKVGTSLLYPAKPLVDLWNKIYTNDIPIRIQIVPMENGKTNLLSIMSELGKTIDCFVAPCEAEQVYKNCSFLKLGKYDCCLAVSRNHRLAKLKKIKWKDLDGETIMLVKKGNSPAIDKIRNKIENKYPNIKISDTKTYYDIDVFNECEQKGYVMEVLSSWNEIHPSLVTVPVDWNYSIDYGIIYPKKNTNKIKTFINTIQNKVENIK